MRLRRAVGGFIASLFIALFLNQPALAATETILPPYQDSGVENSCGVVIVVIAGLCLPSPGTTANSETGDLTLLLLTGSGTCLFCGPTPASGKAWVRAVHQLPIDASSVDYAINLDLGAIIIRGEDGVIIWGDGLIGMWVDVGSAACGCHASGGRLLAGDSQPEAAAGRLTIPVTLTGPLTAGPIEIKVTLTGWVSSVVPTEASAEARVTSIGATVPGRMNLQATSYKVNGKKRVDLSWTGATSSQVDVFRNSTYIARTDNDGAYSDIISEKGGGIYTYQVCEAGTRLCSNEAQA